MSEISEDTHVDKAEAWDRNAQKNEEIKRLKSESERLKKCLIEIDTAMDAGDAITATLMLADLVKSVKPGERS